MQSLTYDIIDTRHNDNVGRHGNRTTYANLQPQNADEIGGSHINNNQQSQNDVYYEVV